MHIKDLNTPCLVLNKTVVQKNIDTMQGHLDSLGMTLRPHGKTAKNIDVINMFASKHRQKITVSTLKEAEYFFEQGVRDIMYAVGIAPCKLPRITSLIQRGANISVVLDTLEQATFLSSWGNEHKVVIPALIEIDCDNHRAGIQPQDPTLVEIGVALDKLPGVCLKGIMTHAGGSYDSDNIQQIQNVAKQERQSALDSVERLNQHKLHCEVVSIGSTPTAMLSENLDGITEVRAGVFMFYDLVMQGLGICKTQDIALSVLTSVIGRNQRKKWLFVDAGWMALSRDRGTHNQTVDYQYGLVCDIEGNPLSDLLVESTNQEHGIVPYPTALADQLENIAIGGKFRILPNHACASAAMHDKYYVTEDNQSICDVWKRVNGW